jgi:hypothetical protein
MKKSFWITLTFSLGYLVVALASLVCWGSSDPWLRLDFFSGGYLTLRFLGCIHSLVSSREVFDSKPVMREWWALESDHSAPPLVVFLMVADLAVFLDYGHWHLVAAVASERGPGTVSGGRDLDGYLPRQVLQSRKR